MTKMSVLRAVSPYCRPAQMSQITSIRFIAACPLQVCMQLEVLDLFCGPGGLSTGMESAGNEEFGFNVVAANDCDASVKATYARNSPGANFIGGSIADPDVRQSVIDAADGIGVVIGGPPCKGFSLENKRTRNMDNPMNHLVEHYLDVVRHVRPTVFIMENVPGLLAMEGGMVAWHILERFRRMGYRNATSWLLNAADYGVPQTRRRAFLVGSLSGDAIRPPRKTHSPYVTLGDAISDLPEILPGDATSGKSTYAAPPENTFQRKMRGGLRRVLNHITTKNQPHVTERIRRVPPGGNWSDIPEHLMRVDGKYRDMSYTHSMIYKRLSIRKPAITITNFRKAMIIHPKQDRLLSVREAARIQTFPDKFEFMGGISSQQQQVSDAVPVLLAKAVGEAVLEHVREIER